MTLMDEETDDLVIRLCPAMGIVMEDASADALMVSGKSREERLQVITRLEFAAQQISAIITAIRVSMSAYTTPDAD